MDIRYIIKPLDVELTYNHISMVRTITDLLSRLIPETHRLVLESTKSVICEPSMIEYDFYCNEKVGAIVFTEFIKPLFVLINNYLPSGVLIEHIDDLDAGLQLLYLYETVGNYEMHEKIAAELEMIKIKRGLIEPKPVNKTISPNMHVTLVDDEKIHKKRGRKRRR